MNCSHCGADIGPDRRRRYCEDHQWVPARTGSQERIEARKVRTRDGWRIDRERKRIADDMKRRERLRHRKPARARRHNKGPTKPKVPQLASLRTKALRRNPLIAVVAENFDGELRDLILEQAADDTQFQRKRDLALPNHLSNFWDDAD